MSETLEQRMCKFWLAVGPERWQQGALISEIMAEACRAELEALKNEFEQRISAGQFFCKDDLIQAIRERAE